MEDFIDSMGGSLSEEDSKYFFTQIISGLSYIKKQGSAHRNLSLSTVLLTKNLTIKLSSFQHSERITARPKQMNEIVGDPEFLAPEIHSKNGVIQLYDLSKGDIFAAGVILLKMALGKHYGGPEEKEQSVFGFLKTQNIHAIWARISSKENSSDSKFTENFRDIVEKMLDFNPEKRITLEEVVRHPWLQSNSADEASVQRNKIIAKTH